MAIWVLILKDSETDREAVYRFGPHEGEMGKLAIDKLTGETVQMIALSPDAKSDFYYSRAARRLKQHFDKGEFPDQTEYSA